MGLFLDLLVIVIAVMLLLFVITQVFYPAYTGEPLFPLFRRSAVKAEIAKAEKALEQVAEVTHLQEVVSEVNRRTAELGKKK